MGKIVILSSIEFLFRFLPIFGLVYLVTPRKYRNLVLFLGSLVFYAAAEPVFVLLLLALTFLNYWCGDQIFTDNLREARGRRPAYCRQHKKQMLTLAVSVSAGALILCKILALTVNSRLLPLGLSFYVFKMISYQADLYRGEIRKRPGIMATAAYFTMFPQLTQGPIMRYNDGFYRRGLRRRMSLDKLEDGLFYITLGLGMKVLLADRIAILWNELSKIGYDSISTPLAWLGAYAYTFELYYDFWGYSLIAAGAGMILGFDFILNFDHPYAANGIGDFYRRWHATLGAWFRDYIYIPLGGSRQGNLVTIRNLMIVWILTGLWHGGTMNFLIWGLVLGLFIIVEKFLEAPLMEMSPILGKLHVLVWIPLTWVIFAITDLSELGLYFGRLFPFLGSEGTAVPGDFTRYLGLYWPYFAAGLVLLFPRVYDLVVEHRRNPLVAILMTALFWTAVYFVITQSGNKFLYLNF